MCSNNRQSTEHLCCVWRDRDTFVFFNIYMAGYIDSPDPAYDLKLVIDKGTVDVLKPSWIIDSVEQGEKVPMKKR